MITMTATWLLHDAAVRLLVSGARVVKHHITYHIRVRPSRENMIMASPRRWQLQLATAQNSQWIPYYCGRTVK